ncbi:hypothetical protein [Sphingobacterium sp. T2]|uniref:hypothetical protein n=1 Tax=Sphingobacterium sp. T2 TaxID=1590596 RepID=UPI000B28591A|nr:hypothetical protein [Sphingobacterium sp. T2]
MSKSLSTTEDVLSTIDTSSLVDKAEKKILEYIQVNQLKVGDSFPKSWIYLKCWE